MEEFISKDFGVFTGEEKSYLKQGEFMSMGDCLFSTDGSWKLTMNDNAIYTYRYDKDSGYYIVYWSASFSRQVNSCHAIMQEDGDFCVYEGNDPSHRGELLWQVGINTGRIATILRDGKFCLFNIYFPEHRPGCIAWECGVEGDAAERYEISDVEYDYNHIVKQPPITLNVHSQMICNYTDEEQKVEIKFTAKEIEKHYWENRSSSVYRVADTIIHRIPFGPSIEAKISGQFSDKYIDGHEIITETSQTYVVPVTVSAKTSVKFIATMTKNTLILPYKYIGRFIMKSGWPSYCDLTGNFVLNDVSELQVGLIPIDTNDSTKSRSSIFVENRIMPDDFRNMIIIDHKLIKKVK